jgi:hypothetical protein
MPYASSTYSTAPLIAPKRPAHYLWAVLIARIYEVFPLLCPLCCAPFVVPDLWRADAHHRLHHLQR